MGERGGHPRSSRLADRDALGAEPPLTVLTALQLLAILLLQGEFGLQLGNAALRELPAQLLVLLNEHPAFRHQLFACLAVKERSLPSHNEPISPQRR